MLAQLVRDRRVVRDLAICAAILCVTAVSPIMFWRVLVDRVMYYGSLDTFTVPTNVPELRQMVYDKSAASPA